MNIYCTEQLECLQLIAKNTLYIEAFCFAVAVAGATLFLLFIINKLLINIWGKLY